MGATAHEAQSIATAALDKWPTVEGVSAVLLLQAVARTSCRAAQLLRAQGLSRGASGPHGLELEVKVLHCQPLPLRGPWECREGGGYGPRPAGPCAAPMLAVGGAGRRRGRGHGWG